MTVSLVGTTVTTSYDITSNIMFPPSQPAAPTTSAYTSSGAISNVMINWAAPANGGSDITAYKIEVKQSDGAFI